MAFRAKAVGQLLQRRLVSRIPGLFNRSCSSITTAAATEPAATPLSPAATSKIQYGMNSVYKSSPRHDIAMFFTCTVCETRSAKTFSRETYEKGVVVVRCGGCKNLHLIADRLGLFGERGSIEDFLAAKGEKVRKASDDTYEFQLEDFVGSKPKEEAAAPEGSSG